MAQIIKFEQCLVVFFEMENIRISLIVICTMVVSAALAQKHLEEEKNVLHYFSEGILSGQIRDFTMATINNGDLNDYYANAIGASIHYETLPYKGFSIALNGIFVYRAFSNDLLALDSNAQKHSLYELQLFDIEHKGNFTDLDRLEELYLKYERKHLTLTYGKMEIESPLVRLHDGRMKPKVFSGFKIDVRLNSHKLTGAWFNKASPRSTTHWYSIADAIGLYDNGYTTLGDEATYYQHVSSEGLGVLGHEWSPAQAVRLNAWNYFLENISNSTLIQLDLKKDTGFYGGLLYLYQTPLNNGGNLNSDNTFHLATERTHLLSARLGYHFNFCDARINATHVLSSGRFLFPREFGVDPSYTYISRSQIEGQGNATSIGFTGIKKIKRVGVQLDWNRMLTKNNALYNKYLMPSYDQFNVDCSYTFMHKLEGLQLRLLYIHRRALSRNIPIIDQHNAVNFNQFNLIANFNFSTSKNHGHFHH